MNTTSNYSATTFSMPCSTFIPSYLYQTTGTGLQPVYTKTVSNMDICDDGYKEWVEKNVLKKEDNKMDSGLFNGIFGKIAPGMCRISMSGKIAIKTSNGYKTFDWKTGRLTNCDNFAFDIGEDFFFVIPTNKVEPGDIVLVNGKPRCILEVGKNEIKTFCYEDSTISTIVPERHMFMGKNYFYGKIISMFGEMGNTKMLKFLMLKEMMSGSNNTNLPMLAMMMGGMGSNNFFDWIFDVEEDENEEVEENG